MEIKWFSEEQLYANPLIKNGCETITRQAQEEGYINTLAYTSDAGTIVAIEGNEVVGYLSMSHWCSPELQPWWIENETVYVEQIVVASSARGKGIARVLYEQLFASFGYSLVMCSISKKNELSQAVHESLGFEKLESHLDYCLYAKSV